MGHVATSIGECLCAIHGGKAGNILVGADAVGLAAEQIAGAARDADRQDGHMGSAREGEGEIRRAVQKCAFAGIER